MGVSIADVEKVENNAAVLSEILTPAEIKKLSEYKFQKRKIEWLTGRVALKILAVDYVREKLGVSTPLNGFSIVSEGDQPRLVPESSLDKNQAEFLENLKASISHTKNIGTAVVWSQPIGVDVEVWRVLENRIISKFLSEKERNLLPSDEYIALWTAKEAVCKAHGSGFGIGDLLKIHISEFGYNEPYTAIIGDAQKQFQITTFKDDNWVVSIAREISR